MAHCVRHYEEPMEATCRACHRTFCNRCLVYSFGPNKPPFCVGCALSASGVRTTKLVAAGAAPAEAGPKPDRRAERAERRAAKAEARAMRRAAKRGRDGDADDERSTAVPAPHDLTIPSSRYGPGEHVVS